MSIAQIQQMAAVSPNMQITVPVSELLALIKSVAAPEVHQAVVPQRRYFTREDAAQELNVCSRTIDGYIRKGLIQDGDIRRVGGRVLISRQAIDKLLK